MSFGATNGSVQGLSSHGTHG